ncbi:MAG: type II secretion system F family protein [Candidatus Aenigmatarchaeota archaeon]
MTKGFFLKLSRRLFKPYASMLKPYFRDIAKSLQKSNMGYTVEEYLSLALFLVTITFVVESVFLTMIFSIILQNALFALVLGLVLSIAVTCGLVFLFYIYPGTAAGNREKNIEKMLPFATAYLTAIASGNVQMSAMFETLSKFEKYGEIGIEAKTIARNIDLFGMTAVESIRRVAERTPSEDLRDLLFGVNNILISGGNIMDYLDGQSNELMASYRRAITKYAQNLSLFVEIYLTLLITGSVFFIVLSSVIAVISGGLGTVLLQTFVVFILLPLISIAFIVLIKSMSPMD